MISLLSDRNGELSLYGPHSSPNNHLDLAQSVNPHMLSRHLYL